MTFPRGSILVTNMWTLTLAQSNSMNHHEQPQGVVRDRTEGLPTNLKPKLPQVDGQEAWD